MTFPYLSLICFAKDLAYNNTSIFVCGHAGPVSSILNSLNNSLDGSVQRVFGDENAISKDVAADIPSHNLNDFDRQGPQFLSSMISVALERVTLSSEWRYVNSPHEEFWYTG